MSIIISMKPKYSNLIFEGRKTVELRRKLGTQFKHGSKLYVYASSPLKVLYGSAIIERINILSIQAIRDRYNHKACVSDSECSAYFAGCAVGYVIELTDVVE